MQYSKIMVKTKKFRNYGSRRTGRRGGCFGGG